MQIQSRDRARVSGNRSAVRTLLIPYPNNTIARPCNRTRASEEDVVNSTIVRLQCRQLLLSRERVDSSDTVNTSDQREFPRSRQRQRFCAGVDGLGD